MRPLYTSIAVLVAVLAGCANSYEAPVRPVPQFSKLSPELENLTDAKIETYLKANAEPAFPAVLAVAKVGSPEERRYGHVYETTERGDLQILRGEEADGWRKLDGLKAGDRQLISQVQFVNSLLGGSRPTLKDLRDAAALLHASLLLVYMQADDAEDGYNELAMAYWTIVGLFTVPGNSVGYFSVCQGVLVDTRSGFILGTAGGESQREERVLPGAVDIARRRTREQARADAVVHLQVAVPESLRALGDRKAANPANN